MASGGAAHRASRTAPGARASCRPPTCAPCSGWCAVRSTRRADPDLLVGFDTADDAAVYRLRDDLAIVVTTDFFTPIVDDPYDWGRIAATNALSDVYAMGGAPLLALNLVAWPREGLAVRPARARARRRRPTSCVPPARSSAVATRSTTPSRSSGSRSSAPSIPPHVFTNRGARAGDVLVLTKPIGLGVISTAVKRDAAPTDARRRGDPRDDDAQRRRARRRARARRRGARGHRRHRLRAARPSARGARRVRAGSRDRRSTRCR